MLISIALDSCKSNNKRAAVKGSPRNFRSKMPNKLLEFFRDNDACYVKKRATDLIDVCTIRFETDDIIFRNMDDGLNFTIKLLNPLQLEIGEVKKYQFTFHTLILKNQISNLRELRMREYYFFLFFQPYF